MSTSILVVLAEIHLALGLIDFSEFEERIEVACWLESDSSNEPDPREPNLPEALQEEFQQPEESANPADQVPRSGNPDEPEWMELVVLNKWYFTRSDPDTYPSTPHGHLHSANRAWPKLNPYTGRAFKAKHQEDTSLRMKKFEMQQLWRDPAFRNFCRSHVIWYMETHPHYTFGIRHPLRFPKW